MGTLIRFPEQMLTFRTGVADDDRREPATVIILPVVRIERITDEPSADLTHSAGSRSRSGRKRRGRATRS
jgi:hypothetical protein